VRGQETRQLSVDKPSAIADLKTVEGAVLVNAKWYIQPAYIADADFKSPGPSLSDKMLLYPTGMNIKTHTIHPQSEPRILIKILCWCNQQILKCAKAWDWFNCMVQSNIDNSSGYREIKYNRYYRSI